MMTKYPTTNKLHMQSSQIQLHFSWITLSLYFCSKIQLLQPVTLGQRAPIWVTTSQHYLITDRRIIYFNCCTSFKMKYNTGSRSESFQKFDVRQLCCWSPLVDRTPVRIPYGIPVASNNNNTNFVLTKPPEKRSIFATLLARSIWNGRNQFT